MASSKRTPEQKARKNARARELYRTDPEYRERHNASVRNKPPRECVECHRVKKIRSQGLCYACKGRERRRLHGDKQRAYERRWRERNREQERERGRTRRWFDPLAEMLKAARWRADIAGVPFALTKRDIKMPERCPVLGTKMVPARGRATDASPSLDRIVPTLGYVPGNVCVISRRANTLKRDGALSEFRALVKYLEAAQ